PTLSLHDALPISRTGERSPVGNGHRSEAIGQVLKGERVRAPDRGLAERTGAWSERPNFRTLFVTPLELAQEVVVVDRHAPELLIGQHVLDVNLDHGMKGAHPRDERRFRLRNAFDDRFERRRGACGWSLLRTGGRSTGHAA